MGILLVHGQSRRSMRLHAMQDMDLAFPIYDPENRYLVHNANVPLPDFLREFEFQGIIFTHSFFSLMHSRRGFARLSEEWSWLISRDIKKVALPQDDYMCSENRDSWYTEMSMDAVFPVCPQDSWERLIPQYLKSGGLAKKGQTAYITPRLRKMFRDWAEPIDREWDIVYRTLGKPRIPNSVGQLKYDISDNIQPVASRIGLRVDLSNQLADSKSGSDWLRFLGSARSALGTPSGSSVRIRNHDVLEAVSAEPKDDAALLMKAGLLTEEDSDYSYTALSPRNFEAMAVGTVQLLTPGNYDGVLTPDVNCLQIQPDGSNLVEVAGLLRDNRLLKDLAERSRESFLLKSELSIESLISQIAEIMFGSGDQRREPSNRSWEALVERYEAFKGRREIVVATKERSRELLHNSLPPGVWRGLRSLYHSSGLR